MLTRTVLEDIIETVRPKKKRLITKKRVVMALNVASEMLGVLKFQQPALAPLHGVLTTLLQPVDVENPDVAQRTITRIKNLKRKMASASDAEQQQIKVQIDTLYELLVGEE